jgi:hypothetical protein
MIGLFLAILELIREKLIGAEQQGSSIYLRPLTEKNAEQAVQEAIFTLTEANNEQAVQAKQPEKPPIPIAELPPESQQRASATEYEKMESSNKQQGEN